MSNARSQDELLAIGHIARPHGVLGELSVIALAPPVLHGEELLLGHELFLRDPKGKARVITCLGVRGHQDRWLVRLEGVETPEDGDLLRGHDLCLRRRDLPALPEGWYWEADIEGCRVIEAGLGELGVAEGLETGGAQPQLMLRRPDGALVLVPWVKAFLRGVDTEARVIQLELPLGFPGISDDEG